MVKKKWFHQKLSTVKPVLKYHHKINRLKFALSFVKPNFQFDKMYEYVHIDEKWFYLTKIKNKYFLVPGEDIPNRQVCNKRFITKVMFMAAVARPRYDYNKKAMFDGKIGIWPFVYKDTAKRTTHKQKKGDLITKIIPKINRDVVRKMLIDNVLPAIKSKWPKSGSNIIIQQDNAGPHLHPDDDELMEAMQHPKFEIKLVCQPSNSPDFNVLDLGFFNSIQSLQIKCVPDGIDDLIGHTIDAFNKVNHESLNDVFLTLQKCMEASMLCDGGNSYKIPHIGKKKLKREGRLPETITCDIEAYEKASSSVRESDIVDQVFTGEYHEDDPLMEDLEHFFAEFDVIDDAHEVCNTD